MVSVRYSAWSRIGPVSVRPRSADIGSMARFGVLSGFVRVSAREQRIASSALLPTPSGSSMFPPVPGSGDVFALGVPTGASAGE
ncbi:conserved domain protein [Actinomyces sp. oral taxon 170 str. F0386]|nr:conserved domain protein [Actinomyces sp. oral taxon 170 str. F0386]